ncbi:hypothetical protein C7S14_8433 [Burkholderia cepacia]|nr:hypothetical protein C7S14_8433 [Burkholderia cepacia]
MDRDVSRSVPASGESGRLDAWATSPRAGIPPARVTPATRPPP